MKRYFDYLYETGFQDDKHKKLALYLFSIPYEWTLDMDENRMWDGIEMRREFEELCKVDRHYDIETCLSGGACTMLEFFVGFAYRLVRDMFSHDLFDMSFVPRLIQMWLENLDIWEGWDDKDYDEANEDLMQDKLDDWIELRYDYDGRRGGIFVINDPKEDLNETEMWVQASWWYNYFTSNGVYGIDGRP